MFVIPFSSWAQEVNVDDVLNFAVDWYKEGDGNGNMGFYKDGFKSTFKSTLSDNISDYLSGKIAPQANDIEKYLVKEALLGLTDYVSGSDFFNWGDFFSGGLKIGANLISDKIINLAESSNFEEESAKLADFAYERPMLNEIDRKYGLYDVTTAYSSMPQTLTKTTNNIINAYTPKKISLMGNGKMGVHLDAKAETSLYNCKIDELSDVYSQPTIAIVNEKYPNLIPVLMQMAQNDLRVPMLINTNPLLYLEYVNKTCNTLIKDKTIQMVYWTETFNKKPKNWPEKVPFAQYSDLKFSGSTDVSATDRVIAHISGTDVQAKDFEMLNHKMIPMSKLTFNGSIFYTDKLGRIDQIGCRLSKGKCKQKTKYKAKNIIAEYNVPLSKPFFVIPKKCNGPECIANVLPMVKTPQNKENMKTLKKNIKYGVKENLIMMTKITYVGSSSKIYSVSYQIGKTNVILKVQ